MFTPAPQADFTDLSHVILTTFWSTPTLSLMFICLYLFFSHQTPQWWTIAPIKYFYLFWGNIFNFINVKFYMWLQDILRANVNEVQTVHTYIWSPPGIIGHGHHLQYFFVLLLSQFSILILTSKQSFPLGNCRLVLHCAWLSTPVLVKKLPGLGHPEGLPDLACPSHSALSVIFK